MTEEKVKEMLKVNYEIATINRVMKIKFNIVVKPEEDKVNEPNFKMESFYQINGNNYYVFKPSPLRIIRSIKTNWQSKSFDSMAETISFPLR